MQLSYFEFWQHDNLAWLDFTLESSVGSRYQMHFISRLKVQSVEQYKLGCAQGNCNRRVSLSLSASALTVHSVHCPCEGWKLRLRSMSGAGETSQAETSIGDRATAMLILFYVLLFSEVTSFLIVEKVNVWSLQLHVTEQLLTLGNVLEILKLEILAETCDGGPVNWCQT